MKNNRKIKKIIVFIILLIILTSVAPISKSVARTIVVNKAYRLLFVMEDSEIQQVIPVCIGKGGESETPTGTFAIINIIHNPNWYFEGKTYKPYVEDKENGLGICWMGISLSGYGLHGTNEPLSPGKNLSHGCVRMNNSDVEKLSKISFVGESVEIREGENDIIAKHLEGIHILYNIENILGESK